jgi:hypothetical protein
MRLGNSHSKPPDMDKLEEEWTPRCVASHFKIDHKDGRPIGCNGRADYIFSKTCGLGWRFALRYDADANPPEVEVYFDPHAADVDMKNIRVATRHLDEGTITAKATDFERLPKGREMISCWQIEDVINNPHICFIVIFPLIKFTSEAEDQTLPRKVLADSMGTGSFVDMQFVAVSKRLSPSTVGAPKSIFANSTLLTKGGRPSILDKCSYIYVKKLLQDFGLICTRCHRQPNGVNFHGFRRRYSLP